MCARYVLSDCRFETKCPLREFSPVKMERLARVRDSE